MFKLNPWVKEWQKKLSFQNQCDNLNWNRLKCILILKTKLWDWINEDFPKYLIESIHTEWIDSIWYQWIDSEQIRIDSLWCWWIDSVRNWIDSPGLGWIDSSQRWIDSISLLLYFHGRLHIRTIPYISPNWEISSC